MIMFAVPLAHRAGFFMLPPTDSHCAGFYFVRHGQTAANRAGIRSGSESDAKLTTYGCKQSHSVARRLLASPYPPPGLIIAANMSRTLNTVRIIRSHLNLRFFVRNGFMERRLGQWNFKSVDATKPMLQMGWTPPGGESEWAFRTRAWNAFENLSHFYPRWPLVVSSQGVGRILFTKIGVNLGGNVMNGQLFYILLSQLEPMDVQAVVELGEGNLREIWSICS